MAKLFYAGIARGGEVLVATNYKRIEKAMQRKKLARQNVALFLCTRNGGSGEIELERRNNGKKISFKPSLNQIESLKRRCRKFKAVS